MTNVQGSSQAVSALSKVETLMAKFIPVVREVLPRFIPPEAFSRTALHYAKTNPKVLECSLETFFGALMESGQLGLMPDGILGDAWVVPYKRKATLIPGYQGLMGLSYRSGLVSNIGGRVVYEKDEWDYREGDQPRIHHVPCRTPERGDPIAVYSIAQLTDPNAPPSRFWLWWWEVDKIQKDFCKTIKEDTPWYTHKPEMGVKSAIRRNCKYLPRSLHGNDQALRRAVVLDEKVEAAVPVIRSWDLPMPGPVVQGSNLTRLMDDVGSGFSEEEGEPETIVQDPPQEAQEAAPEPSEQNPTQDKGQAPEPSGAKTEEPPKPKMSIGGGSSVPKTTPPPPPKPAQTSAAAAEAGLKDLVPQVGTLYLQAVEKIPEPRPEEATNVIHELCQVVFGRPWEKVSVAKRNAFLTKLGIRAGQGQGLTNEDLDALTGR